MDINRDSDDSSSSDVSGTRKTTSKKYKKRPSDDLDKKLLLQNLALKSEDYNLFKRATQLETAEMTE